MKKVLIVEDDIDTIDIIALLLQDGGYAVIKINRRISITEIAGINPDLAIIDFLLPYGLGDELCLEIKNNELTKHIPVILYSASHMLEKIAGKCKADEFISKPFDLDYLMNTINRLINPEAN